MSQNSIFDKQWLDVVFEGKNKAYGAYQLRQESGRTTTKAFLLALGLLGIAVATPSIMNAFAPKGHTSFTQPLTNMDSTVIVLAKVEPLKKEPVIEQKKTASAAAKDPSLKNLRKFVATEKQNVTQETPDITQIAPGTVSETPGDPNPGDVTTGSGPKGGPGIANIPDAPAGPMIAASLDKKPEFPGGLKGFYNYIARNYKPSDESQEVETQLKVTVSFVVERDGSLTDIKVLRDPGYGLGKEAIRVLKALKTKWEPGIYRGEKVRTLYTLPISITKGES